MSVPAKPRRRAAKDLIAAALLLALPTGGRTAVAAARHIAPPPRTKRPKQAVLPPSPAARSVDGATIRETVHAKDVLARACYSCHGPDQQLSGLDMCSFKSLVKGGRRGPAIVPGKPDESRLYRMAAGLDQPSMPPKGPRLAAEDLAALRDWIAAGAPDAPKGVMAGKDWWSYQPIVRPAVPAVKDAAWVRNPIDAFILAGLERDGLKPAPPAKAATLMRRLYFDLTGLPPTPEEVADFTEDRSPTAYEDLARDLMALPYFGEKWARKWLDVVRYADSSGYDRDRDRPNAWRYRDYVIRSFNEDKPYDRFVREQLAADEIVPEDSASQAALGFLAAGPSRDDRPEFRPEDQSELIGTTTSVFLAQTVGCAKCHDHKFDPIPQEDYYRFAALFAGVRRKQVVVADANERQAAALRSAEVDSEEKPLKDELAMLEFPYRRQLALIDGPKGKSKGDPDKVDPMKLEEAIPSPQKERRKELLDQIARIEPKRVAAAACFGVGEETNRPPRTFLLKGGEQNRPGQEVEPGFMRVLTDGKERVAPAPAGSATSYRRKALAEWIASPENPLTARVIVNRLWQWHFGRGLAATPSNFGKLGEKPTHPELLDWLASELIANKWSLKHIHSLIVNSNTFRQTTEASAETIAKDPGNRLWSRMPLRRLEAEEVRDSMLFVSGSLNPEMGGPGVFPPIDRELRQGRGGEWPEKPEGPEVWRRSVYINQRRTLQLPLLYAFDAPDGNMPQPVRDETTVVTQALALLNDPFTRLMAERFAARLHRDAGVSQTMQIERAYLLAFGRKPETAETDAALSFLKAQLAVHTQGVPKTPARKRGQPAPPPQPRGNPVNAALADFCQALLNSSEFLYAE